MRFSGHKTDSMVKCHRVIDGGVARTRHSGHAAQVLPLRAEGENPGEESVSRAPNRAALHASFGNASASIDRHGRFVKD
jgi:hypothetical protein